jgi:hypothetical protein
MLWPIIGVHMRQTIATLGKGTVIMLGVIAFGLTIFAMLALIGVVKVVIPVGVLLGLLTIAGIISVAHAQALVLWAALIGGILGLLMGAGALAGAQ